MTDERATQIIERGLLAMIAIALIALGAALTDSYDTLTEVTAATASALIYVSMVAAFVLNHPLVRLLLLTPVIDQEREEPDA